MVTFLNRFTEGGKKGKRRGYLSVWRVEEKLALLMKSSIAIKAASIDLGLGYIPRRVDVPSVELCMRLHMFNPPNPSARFFGGSAGR